MFSSINLITICYEYHRLLPTLLQGLKFTEHDRMDEDETENIENEASK